MWAISTKDDNSHLASCLRDLADLPVPDLFKVVVRKWFSKLCWKLSFTPSLSGQQRWRPSAPGCPSCTAPDQPGYRVWSDLSFNNFICFLLFNLNEEDEDDAEPPEFHCSENCAKDVALRSFSLSSWYISQGSPAQLLFICSLLFLSIFFLRLLLKITRATETRSPRMFWMESPDQNYFWGTDNHKYGWYELIWRLNSSEFNWPMYSPEVPELSLILFSTNLELPEIYFAHSSIL